MGWGLVVAALSGCGQRTQLETFSVSTTMPSERAFAFPAPGGPSITAVLQTSYANALEQDILLSNSAHTSGQNLLRVQLFGTFNEAPLGVPALRDKSVSGPSISSEMRSLFPGVRMARSGVYVQNKYGPFGYATGHTQAGDTCLYAWQRVASTKSRQTVFGNRGAVQVRLRLCDATASEERLLATMYDYTIVASVGGGGWNPYGDAPPADPQLGQPHRPVYPAAPPPSSFGATADVAVEAPQPRRAPPARRRVARVAVVEEPALPEPIGPLVPPPPASAGAAGAKPVTKSLIVPPPP